MLRTVLLFRTASALPLLWTRPVGPLLTPLLLRAVLLLWLVLALLWLLWPVLLLRAILLLRLVRFRLLAGLSRFCLLRPLLLAWALLPVWLLALLLAALPLRVPALCILLGLAAAAAFAFLVTAAFQCLQRYLAHVINKAHIYFNPGFIAA